MPGMEGTVNNNLGNNLAQKNKANKEYFGCKTVSKGPKEKRVLNKPIFKVPTSNRFSTLSDSVTLTDNELNHKCTKCEKLFTTMNSLEIHTKNEHSVHKRNRENKGNEELS